MNTKKEKEGIGSPTEVVRSRVRPITPEEVVGEKAIQIPDSVIESFNKLIVQNTRGDSATVLQKDVVELLIEKGLDRGDVFNKNWLDVEGIYEEAGWEVKYDKPGYNESYEPHFTFRLSRKRRKR